jgi:fructose/tagatose bisphosphate aldolase
VEAMSGELATSLDGTGHRLEAGHLTMPEEAARFAEETGIDALAVAIGNVHTLTEEKATVNFDLLAKIREATDVPLVAHGGTGFAYNDLQKAIRVGICKVNVGAIFKKVYIEGMKVILDRLTGFVNPHTLLGSGGPSDVMTAGKLRMKEKVRELIRVCGSNGKA